MKQTPNLMLLWPKKSSATAHVRFSYLCNHRLTGSYSGPEVGLLEIWNGKRAYRHQLPYRRLSGNCKKWSRNRSFL